MGYLIRSKQTKMKLLHIKVHMSKMTKLTESFTGPENLKGI